MLYRVSAQYLRGGEIFIAEFSRQDDAILFLAMKQEKDQYLKVNVTYRLYEGGDVIETLEGESGSSAWQGAPASSTGAQSAGGAGSSFNPSPFGAVPRPAGMPQHWRKEDDRSDEKK